MALNIKAIELKCICLIAGATSCDCPDAPSSKARKELRKYVDWNPQMATLSSDEFKALKKEVEEEVNESGLPVWIILKRPKLM